MDEIVEDQVCGYFSPVGGEHYVVPKRVFSFPEEAQRFFGTARAYKEARVRAWRKDREPARGESNTS